MKTKDLRDALAKKYCAPEWAFFSELAPETGYPGRRMDACALRLWRSGSGFTFLGFELKVSVADFRNDLKDPTKFQETYEVCDGAFYVTPKGLLDIFEVPAWCSGILELNPDGTWNEFKRHIYKKAKDMPRGTVAALARKCDPRNLDSRLEWAHETNRRKIEELKTDIRNDRWRIRQAYEELARCI